VLGRGCEWFGWVHSSRRHIQRRVGRRDRGGAGERGRRGEGMIRRDWIQGRVFVEIGMLERPERVVSGTGFSLNRDRGH